MHRYVVITPIGDTVRQRLMLLSYHPGRCAEHAAIAKARATRYLVITPAGASCHLFINPTTTPAQPANDTLHPSAALGSNRDVLLQGHRRMQVRLDAEGQGRPDQLQEAQGALRPRRGARAAGRVYTLRYITVCNV